MKCINKIFSSFVLFLMITLLLGCPLNECPVCLNGGTYIENTEECDCPPEYRGTHCEFPVSPCDSITCLNYGICVDGRCDCPPEYAGIHCELLINPCDSITCLNGGVCVNGQCDCTEGWTGTDCSKKVVTMITISPMPIDLCPEQTSGANANFLGNGPLVNISISLSVINSNEIRANIVFELEQTATNNPTIGYAETDVSIYTAPEGKRIAEITSDLSCTPTEYTDIDYFMDVLQSAECSIVDRFEVYGDTPGNDFGDCDTDEDAQLTVYFNFIEITLINE